MNNQTLLNFNDLYITRIATFSLPNKGDQCGAQLAGRCGGKRLQFYCAGKIMFLLKILYLKRDKISQLKQLQRI